MKRLIIAICLACIFLPSVEVDAAGKTPKKRNIEQFIDDILNERISPDEMMAIKASLTPAQEKQAWNFFHAKVKPVEHTREQQEALMRETSVEEQAALPPQGGPSIQACDPGAAPDCWRQIVEKAATAGGGSGSQGYYTTTLRCDNQEDIDYVFGF